MLIKKFLVQQELAPPTSVTGEIHTQLLNYVKWMEVPNFIQWTNRGIKIFQNHPMIFHMNTGSSKNPCEMKKNLYRCLNDIK